MLPLEGIRVFDYTHFLSGPYCSMLLADLGADVVKVERPNTGDVYRGYGPKFIRNESTSFLAVNRNKRSLVLNLKDPEGRKIARQLAEKADVIIENFKMGTMEKMGLDYKTLSENNPRLVYCSISGFGRSGPYKERGGFDLILQGMSGIMSVTGYPDLPPVKVGVPITDIGAGIFSVVGILVALMQREKTGKGQLVDASLLEAGLGFATLTAINYFADGQIPKRLGSASNQNAPYQAFETRDGYINVGTGNEDLWRRFCEVLSLTQLIKDPRFEDNARRVRNQEELNQVIAPAIKKKSTEDCLDLFNQAGIPCGPIYDIGQAVTDPHVRERGILLEYEHPQAGQIKNIGFPVKLSALDVGVRRHPPHLGQHSFEVLEEAGVSTNQIKKFEKAGIIQQWH